MKQAAFVATVLLLASLNLGCVERRFVITSDPPGALVYRNGVPIGTTPCDDHFVYYGKYKFTLVRDKFATLEVEEKIRPPWYEYPGVDFVSENIFPCKLIDVRRLHYKLPPLVPEDQQEVLSEARALRARGQLIGAPRIPRAPLPNQPGQPPPPGQEIPPPDAALPPPAPPGPQPGVPMPLPQGPLNPPSSLPGGGTLPDPNGRPGIPGGT